MNLYAMTERAFGPAEVRVGNMFAMQAAFVLSNAQAYWDARTLSENLEQATRSRAVIEQAKGVVMAAERCDERHAFALLVDRSERERRTLRDVAAAIVEDATRHVA